MLYKYLQDGASVNKFFMKYIYFIAWCLLFKTSMAQEKPTSYPNPEYLNEVYLLKKDSMKLVRLEKFNTELETKTKLGGFAGAEYGYYIDGERSKLRLNHGDNLVFVFYSGEEDMNNKKAVDSVLEANNMSSEDLRLDQHSNPLQNATLYKTTVSKGQRKILLQSATVNYGGKKKDTNKHSFSLKKIKAGYYELAVDNSLPKGEYAFALMGAGSNYMQTTLFCFGID